MEKMTESEAEDRYNEYLDDMSLDNFNLPPTSVVLKEIDPIQYDCEFANFCDAEGIEIE